MENKLHIGVSPHIVTRRTTSRIMLDVIIALIPALVAGTVIFGLRALLVTAVTVATAVISELVFCLVTGRRNTVGDLSAVVTGLLLGLNLPADAPIWQCAVGSVFAIIAVKCLFGGIGQNFANPAITARVFLLISFAGTIGGGAIPRISSDPDLVGGATPLSVISSGGELPSLIDMLLGLRGGAIGETCAVAIALGFVYVVVRRVIYFETPIIYVATVFVLSLIAYNSFTIALYQVLAGSLLIGAVFMITDYSSTPITRDGKMIFAFGCGIITFMIRYFGTYPEGVSFAILIMNVLSPFIEKWTVRRPFGGEIK